MKPRWRKIKFWCWPPAFVWWQITRSAGMVKVYRSSSDGDWATIGYPMLYAIRRVRLHMQDHQIVVGWERNCRQMLIAETALTRLLDDNYGELAMNEFTGVMGGQRWARHWNYLERQDRELLGKTISKHLTSWWD